MYRRGAVAAKSVAASGFEFVSSEWNMAPSSGFWAWSCWVRSFACRAMSAAAPTEGGAESLAHLAIGQIEDLSILPHAPPLLAFHYQKAMAAIAAEEEVEAAAAEGLGGGEEEQADADGAAEAEAATGAE